MHWSITFLRPHLMVAMEHASTVPRKMCMQGEGSFIGIRVVLVFCTPPVSSCMSWSYLHFRRGNNEMLH